MGQSKGGFKLIWLFFGFLALIPFAIGALLWLNAHYRLGDNPTLEALGNYGSYLQGTVASLWALAGVVLVAGAFLAQASQLRLQNQELDEQREQFTKQNFEDTLFKLLELQNQVAAQTNVSISANHTTEDFTGRDAFRALYVYFQERLEGSLIAPDLAVTLGMRPEGLETDTRKIIEKCYQSFYDDHSASLRQYFKNLYHLMRFIQQGKVKDKKWYAELAAMQLSTFETALLFYYGLSVSGQQMKPLIEEFGLLERLEKELLPESKSEELLKYYAESAYR